MENSVITALKTERLMLRPIVASDIDAVFKGLSDPEVIKYYGVNFQSLEATKEQMSFYEDLKKNGTGIWFAICSLDNTVFFGAAGLNDLNQEHKKAEIGFWLMKEFWGQGIVVEVLQLICNYGFDVLGLHRIEGFVESNNLKCKRAMSKLDFRLEGTMIDSEIKNGEFISLDIYAKINAQ
ncbi:GNAT family N-acetyltransferase [Algoriphagus halophytocola]|uniref:GNAT family N-acetyltransferase n=1 Tax=Algoriphagus halophytocola TaxID=2991499 RepID=A0ABY6MGW1_9BACT|nr:MULTISPECIES: GNAT family N-acetyltransferase [unclassified Algoriphagus]UZD22878.1 GNAT family N-acetyltransferase [Algoriphagus sp. TR-M5]WBL44145.1 GNAT family N-acetyltransferase [Algoriphagus sp. TR-M9]